MSSRSVREQQAAMLAAKASADTPAVPVPSKAVPSRSQNTLHPRQPKSNPAPAPRGSVLRLALAWPTSPSEAPTSKAPAIAKAQAIPVDLPTPKAMPKPSAAPKQQALPKQPPILMGDPSQPNESLTKAHRRRDRRCDPAERYNLTERVGM